MPSWPSRMMPCETVLATSVERNAPTTLRTAEMSTAVRGLRAPVATEVAMAFAVSWEAVREVEHEGHDDHQHDGDEDVHARDGRPARSPLRERRVNTSARTCFCEDRSVPTFSAARGDSSFTDAHGVEIVYSTWRAARPKGIVQIAHGVGEHSLRYEPLAQDLVRAGWTVVANDHRGHGRTGLAQWDGDHAKLGRLGPGGLRAAIAAVEQLTALAREDTPDVPLVLLGHSWGSLMAQRIVNTSSARYDGIVLSATAYRLPGWMNSGDLNARFAGSGPTKYEWISRDRAVIDAIGLDPSRSRPT